MILDGTSTYHKERPTTQVSCEVLVLVKCYREVYYINEFKLQKLEPQSLSSTLVSIYIVRHVIHKQSKV